MESRDKDSMAALFTSLWMRAFEENRFHDALLTGLASYLVCEQMKDEEGKNTALISIRGAVDRLLPPRLVDENECSFCGRKPPEVRLVAGHDAFICNSCISMVGEMLSETGQS